MSNLRLVFTGRLGDTPISSICFDRLDADQVFVLAETCRSPAELWLENELCSTLLAAGTVSDLQSSHVMIDLLVKQQIERELIATIDA